MPVEFAKRVLLKLRSRHGLEPNTILELSCGVGVFLKASAEVFPASKILGFDINPDYVKEAKKALPPSGKSSVERGDFFSLDWRKILAACPGKLLIVGNPPWVTSSELGLLNSKNMPKKSNFQSLRGIEAITGSSNFDISEWMLLKYAEWISPRRGCAAVLCKYSVARKVFRNVTKNEDQCFEAHVYPIDAKAHFNAAVEACLFVLLPSVGSPTCAVYESLESITPDTWIGSRDGAMVRNLEKYDRWAHLAGQDARYVWRSGIKHDCSKAMELTNKEGVLVNGFGVEVRIEQRYLFPLLKSSDVANGRIHDPHRYAIIPQRSVGENTSRIQSDAPRTWAYLTEYGSYLDKRASLVYRSKPRFSVFGVGDYTFSRWKIAISGLYKKLVFQLIPPRNDRSVSFDDTVYFLSFDAEEEARFVFRLLTSEPAMDFLDSMIFWDEKRPITARVLRKLNIRALARELGCEGRYMQFVGVPAGKQMGQMELGIAEEHKLYPVPRAHTK
jgi:hypothetical protein